MIVPESTDGEVNKKAPGVHSFKVVGGNKNAVWLDIADNSSDAISAYYLPWEKGTATTMNLGADAPYFFTSHLTGCRFSILDGGSGSKSPKVAHVAGNITTSKLRTETEERVGFAPTGEGAERPRRFSISGGSSSKGNPMFKIPPRQQEHEYRGQNGLESSKSSAFIFGKRQEDETWRFYVQVSKGVRNEVAGITLAEDLTILKWRDQELGVRQL
ncbi:MAG TPA: hypothetical protein VGV37_00075 [Aliidongia sp.]|uniref:hypothetical protein n=1 Tax=Aliidongia sp. TaxID=1914230 RepID=UPI002DDD5FE6|nr:hypothetical protein [Aliidongia sp.]HEV2672903.1 hypothetical protein [Aliidongia sp.]